MELSEVFPENPPLKNGYFRVLWLRLLYFQLIRKEKCLTTIYSVCEWYAGILPIPLERIYFNGSETFPAKQYLPSSGFWWLIHPIEARNIGKPVLDPGLHRSCHPICILRYFAFLSLLPNIICSGPCILRTQDQQPCTDFLFLLSLMWHFHLLLSISQSYLVL